MMKTAFASLTGDLAGSYYPLTGMAEDVRQQLVDDHFLFMSGDKNLQVNFAFDFYFPPEAGKEVYKRGCLSVSKSVCSGCFPQNPTSPIIHTM